MIRGKTGASIGSYLLAMAAFGVLVLTIVTTAVHHRYYSAVEQQRQAASNLAESAIHEALLRVLTSAHQSFGSSGSTTEVVRVVSPGYPVGSQGVVCFDPVTARNEKLHLSTNNFHAGGVRPGALGRQVPPNTVHLVATGQCGGTLRTLEALYYLPPFPNALASAGPVRSRGGLLVAGIKDPARFAGSYEATDERDKTTSHVMSNAAVEPAVQLGPGAVIHGNVGAVGTVELHDTVKVHGEVRQRMEPQPLPDLDMAALFQKLNSQVGKDILPSAISGDYSLEWNAQCDTDLHITGSVALHQGVLFVKGNLVVDGGLTGEGAVYVGGRTTIRRGASFRSADQVALVSEGPVHFEGGGKENYFFQGLVYSESDIVANDVTVLGAVIARGLGGLELNNVNILNSPVTVSLKEGLEFVNWSDDDTVQVIIRVEARDPVTRLPTSYKVQLRGRSDDIGGNDVAVSLSPPIEASGLRGYDDIKNFIANSDRSVWGAYAKNAFHLDWYWNASKPEHTSVYGDDPLRTQLDLLEGKDSERARHLVLSLDPNEVLGVLDRARVLLWQDAANPR